MMTMTATENLRHELAFTYNDRKWYAQLAEPKFIVAISKHLDKNPTIRPWSWRKGWKTVGHRAERLCWLEYVVGHNLATSSHLTNGEAYRICNWLDGLHPYTGEYHGVLPIQEISKWRYIEIKQWLRANYSTVYQRAKAFRHAQTGTKPD
jgi:hypothetical protein